jgi:hypothetical protein
VSQKAVPSQDVTNQISVPSFCRMSSLTRRYFLFSLTICFAVSITDPF